MELLGCQLTPPHARLLEMSSRAAALCLQTAIFAQEQANKCHLATLVCKAYVAL